MLVMSTETGHRPKLNVIFTGAILTLALLFPSLLNGEPFYMPDTASYIRAADAGAFKLTGTESVWTDEFHDRYTETLKAEARETDGVDQELSSRPSAQEAVSGRYSDGPVALAGRSVYYGGLLYLGQIPGNFWLVAVLQALLVAAAIMLTVRALIPDHNRKSWRIRALLVGLPVIFLSSAAFFSNFLMPDIFAGLGLLAFVHLIALWNRQSVAERFFWFSLLVSAMLFHNTNVLITVSLLAAVLVAALTRIWRVGWQPILVIITGLFVSFVGQSLFYWGVEKYSGNPPVMPPFLAAKVIEDGPGYRYLEQHCDTIESEFCRVLKFDVINHDLLLWSAEKNVGFFQALPNAEKRKLVAEEKAFLLNVLLEYPGDVVLGSLRGFIAQLFTFNLDSFNYNDQQKLGYEDKIPAEFVAQQQQSAAYENRMPTRFWVVSTIAVSAIALAYLLFIIIRRFRKTSDVDRSTIFALLIILGILGNAAICGALSGAKSRYQMRLIWVLPLAAASIAPSVQRRRAVQQTTE